MALSRKADANGLLDPEPPARAASGGSALEERRSRPSPGDSIQGFGLGLRPCHYEDILSSSPRIDWFELLSENYLDVGGQPLYFLDRICERYPVVMHGVSMTIGGTDPLDFEYLQRLKQLAERTGACWISDHLCWTRHGGQQLHDLMPLPYTEEALRHLSKRIASVQDYLGRQLVLENVSSYLEFECSSLTEAQFLAELLREADCLLLLDVNNVHVSATNHGFEPLRYLDELPTERIVQIHLAGHSDCGTHLIDSHDAPVVPAVWKLYREAIRRFGQVPTMIERDGDIPPLADMLEELDQARNIALSTASCRA